MTAELPPSSSEPDSTASADTAADSSSGYAKITD